MELDGYFAPRSVPFNRFFAIWAHSWITYLKLYPGVESEERLMELVQAEHPEWEIREVIYHKIESWTGDCSICGAQQITLTPKSPFGCINCAKATRDLHCKLTQEEAQAKVDKEQAKQLKKKQNRQIAKTTKKPKKVTVEHPLFSELEVEMEDDPYYAKAKAAEFIEALG